MYNQQPQNQNQNPRRINNWLIFLMAFGAALLVFAFGFELRGIINRNSNKLPPTQQEPIVTEELTEGSIAYQKLFNFFKAHHLNEFDNTQALYAQLSSLVDVLDDPYTSISLFTTSVTEPQSNASHEKEYFTGIGISFVYEDYEMNVNDIMRLSPAEKAKIFPGDKIIGLVKENQDIIFKDVKWEQPQLMDNIVGESGEKRTFIVKRLNDTIVKIEIEYEKFLRPTVVSKKLDENNGYIKINEFQEHTAAVFKTHLTELEAGVLSGENKLLILDLRGNPGGNLSTVVKIMQELVAQDENNSVVFGIRSKDGSDTRNYRALLKEKKTYDIKVLVDSKSASASEMLAAALYYHSGYTLYGENTFGKNIYQSTVTENLTKSIMVSIRYTAGYWHYGNYQIMDKDTNPLPVLPLDKLGILAFENVKYKEDIKLDQVSMELINVQKYLNVLYNLNIREDGYFDQGTEDALKQFQTDKGLTADGIYNLETMHEMFTDYRLHSDNYLNDNQIVHLLKK